MNATPKQVAILGNGVVGVAVAKGFAQLGYQVVFGTRDPASAKSAEALAAVPGARAANYADAASGADLVFVALPWSGLQEALALAGPHNVEGKLVIDASNPLEVVDGAPGLAIGHTDSAGETVQRALPGARVVKAFNIVTAAHMVQPKLPDGQADMFIAGNDAGAKAKVAALLHAFGWRSAIDMGDIKASRLLEPLAMVWISYGVRNNHWRHAFSLLGQTPA